MTNLRRSRAPSPSSSRWPSCLLSSRSSPPSGGNFLRVVPRGHGRANVLALNRSRLRFARPRAYISLLWTGVIGSGCCKKQKCRTRTD